MEEQDFFKQFRTIREERKLSLDDIYTRTRIDPKYLIAIEEGNLSFLPSPYVLAFTKAYAKELGISREAVDKQISLFRQEKKLAETDSWNRFHKPPQDDAAKPDRSFLQTVLAKSLKPRNAAVAGIAILILLASIFQLEKDDRFRRPIDLDEESIVAMGDSLYEELALQTRSESSMPESVMPVGEPRRDLPVHLAMTGLERTWIRMIIDRDRILEFVINPGETLDWWAQDSIQMRVGKARGVDLFLNDRSLGTLGTERALIWDMLVTKNGIVRKETRRRPEVVASPPQRQE